MTKRKLSFKTKFFNFFRKTLTYPPLERGLLAVVRGKRYLGFWNRFVPNPMLYKFHSMRYVQRNGINYALDMSCLMQWYVYWDFSAKDRDKLYSLVKRGDVVFDVGTNIGETLLNFSKLAGKPGMVYGFEPDEENYNNAQKNIALNPFFNVHVFKKAVADKRETRKLYCVDEHNRGMNRILNDESGEGYSYITVETTTLDDVVAESGIKKLDLIKIDIEGYEMHALRGAIQTLKKFRPVLFVEIAYTRLINLGTSPNEVIKFMEDLGYTLTHAGTDEPITSDYDFSYLGDSGFDVVGIPQRIKESVIFNKPHIHVEQSTKQNIAE
jgi:FkbM family methyltransferase